MFLGRVVGQGEPLWLPDDAQAVLDFLSEEALLCPGCGQPRDESMDPASDGRYVARAVRCHSCAARERARKRFMDQDKADMGGLFFATERLPEHEH